jgi:hypothetical protein
MSNKEPTQFQKDLIKALETTKEYKSWQESLFAIIGYASSEDPENKDFVRELMSDHLIASIELQDGLEIAKYKASKKRNDETMLDYSGQ